MRWFCCLLGIILCSHAAASWWSDLWWRADQQGATALQRGDPAAAAQLFENPTWRGVAEYRHGDYQKAAMAFEQNKNALTLYNQGNALAHLQRFDEAIKAYELALKQQPDFPDAVYNRDLLKKLKQQQQKQKQQSKQSQQSKSADQQQQQKNQQQNAKQDQQQQQGKQQQDQQQQSSQQSQQSPSQDQQKKSAQQQQQQAQQDQSSPNKSPPDTKEQAEQQQANQQTAKPTTPKPTDNADNSNPQQRDATAKALQRIPDDPGNLLQQIFLRDYLRRHGQAEVSEETTQ